MKNKSVLFIFCVIIFLLFSCKSTPTVDIENVKVIQTITSPPTNLNGQLNQSHSSSIDEFIFIRIYDITFVSQYPLGKFFKACVKTQGLASNGQNYNHSSIGLSLKDDFVGITAYGKYDVSRESVEKPESEFLKLAVPEESVCTVLAIPCTKMDSENCRMLLEYAANPKSKFKYSLSEILRMPKKITANTKKLKENQFSQNDFWVESVPLTDTPEKIFKTKRYTCTSLIMFILYKSVAWFQNYVDELNLDIRGFSPNDFYNMDSMIFCFSCTFDSYEETVAEFKEKNPIFTKY